MSFQYTLNPSNGTVTVDNADNKGSPSGERNSFYGYAKQVSGGHFEVKFPPAPVYAPYDVVVLKGEAETGYEAAVIYSCTILYRSMWVLSRTPLLEGAVTYESLIMEAEKLGIDVKTLNMQMTHQGSDCKYGL